MPIHSKILSQNDLQDRFNRCYVKDLIELDILKIEAYKVNEEALKSRINYGSKIAL